VHIHTGSVEGDDSNLPTAAGPGHCKVLLVGHQGLSVGTQIADLQVGEPGVLLPWCYADVSELGRPNDRDGFRYILLKKNGFEV